MDRKIFSKVCCYDIYSGGQFAKTENLTIGIFVCVPYFVDFHHYVKQKKVRRLLSSDVQLPMFSIAAAVGKTCLALLGVKKKDVTGHVDSILKRQKTESDTSHAYGHMLQGQILALTKCIKVKKSKLNQPIFI